MVEVRDEVRRGRRVWRLWRWEQLPRLESVLRGPVLELHYQPSAHTWRELETLVDAEQAESPFVTWTLSAQPERLVVHVHAPPDRPDDLRPLALFVQAVDRTTAADRRS